MTARLSSMGYSFMVSVSPPFGKGGMGGIPSPISVRRLMPLRGTASFVDSFSLMVWRGRSAVVLFSAFGTLGSAMTSPLRARVCPRAAIFHAISQLHRRRRLRQLAADLWPSGPDLDDRMHECQGEREIGRERDVHFFAYLVQHRLDIRRDVVHQGLNEHLELGIHD